MRCKNCNIELVRGREERTFVKCSCPKCGESYEVKKRHNPKAKPETDELKITDF